MPLYNIEGEPLKASSLEEALKRIHERIPRLLAQHPERLGSEIVLYECVPVATIKLEKS